MTNKPILALAITAAFVAGSIMTSTMVYAAEKPYGQPFQALWDAITGLQTQIDAIELTPGPQGSPGTNGKNGIDGVDGSSCTIDGTIVSCTDGTSSDVQGPSGNDGQEGKTKTLMRFDSGPEQVVYTNTIFFNFGDTQGDFTQSASLVGVDGVITELLYKIGNSNPSHNGNIITATVYKNNIQTSLSCSITTGTSTSCVGTGSLTVVKGDLLAVADIVSEGNFGNTLGVNGKHAVITIIS